MYVLLYDDVEVVRQRGNRNAAVMFYNPDDAWAEAVDRSNTYGTKLEKYSVAKLTKMRRVERVVSVFEEESN